MKPMLLCDWVGSDVDGWLMSEKYDGWRVVWDGENFYSREEGLLDAPDWFKEGMPSVALDGELWAGRGNFYKIQGLMRDGWHGLEYMVFDFPLVDGVYLERLRSNRIPVLPKQAKRANYEFVYGVEQVIHAGNRVVDEGGEGVVIRDPKGLYHAGKRSRDVLRWVPQDPEINRLR